MQTFHSFEQSGWQRAAGRYGDAFGGLTSQTIPRLLAAANVSPGTRLLDVASGPGYVAAAAASAGASAVGVDFSSEMVRLAAARYPGIVFQEGDAEALAFPDESFDAVTLNFGVLHLARPDAALAEARRVLVARRALRADGLGEARGVRRLRHRAAGDRGARTDGRPAA